MKLQPSYDAVSDVPTGFESAYTEKDGKAVLTGGDFEFKTEADVSAMKKAKDQTNTELSETKSKLKAFDGIDVNTHKGMLDELDVLRAKAKEGGSDEETIKAIVDARVLRKTEELTKANTDLNTENDVLKGFKLKTEKGSTLDKVLNKNVSKDALVDARFIIGSAVERQADGSYMSNGKAGFEKGLSIDQVVAKALESRPHWKKQNTPGHLPKGGGGGNLDKRTQLNALIEKRKKDGLSRAEIKQMTVLAQEIKAE